MTTRPRAEASSAGMAACTAQMVPLTLSANRSSTCCSLRSASFASGKAPALAHRTSRPPSSPSPADRGRSPARSVTSPTTVTTAEAPRPASRPAAVASVSPLRARMATAAPALANTLAMPRPMPGAAGDEHLAVGQVEVMGASFSTTLMLFYTPGTGWEAAALPHPAVLVTVTSRWERINVAAKGAGTSSSCRLSS